MLDLVQLETKSDRSSIPDNPTLESSTKSIGQPVPDTSFENSNMAEV